MFIHIGDATDNDNGNLLYNSLYRDKIKLLLLNVHIRLSNRRMGGNLPASMFV